MGAGTNPGWRDIILGKLDPPAAWKEIFAALESIACGNLSPSALHTATVKPDRLLAEAAWELWQAYPEVADKTSDNLKRWCGQEDGAGRAVLILDALSLRELPFLLGGAESRGLKPRQVKITGAECPSTTDQFAQSLGAPSRAALAHDAKPRGLALFGGACHTDVLNHPFEDCPAPPAPKLLLWHTWLDDLIHAREKNPDAVNQAAAKEFHSSEFWNFIDRLRRGRRLVVTSDHGYAASKLFSSEITNSDYVETLRSVFGASRSVKATPAWPGRFMPPLALEHGRHLAIMGQWKWKIQGGFPGVCHGGLSLLEIAVPWLEFDPI